MYPSKRFVVLGVVAAVALLFLGGRWDRGNWTLIGIVNGLLVGIALLDVLIAPRKHLFEVERIHAPVAVIGSTLPIAWRITNHSRRTAHIELVDQLRPSLNLEHRRISVKLHPRAVAEAESQLAPTRRGRFPIDEAVLRVRSPLGLIWRRHHVELTSVIRVHPPFRLKRQADIAVRLAKNSTAGERTVRGLGSGTEFDQLREFTQDDEFRKIDWAATARTGKTIVRTYRPERNQSVLIMVDNGRLTAPNVEGIQRIEHSIDAAIMLADVATRLGDRVGLVTFDSQVRSVIPLSHTHSQRTRITEALYDLEPVFIESDYSLCFAEVLKRFRRRMFVVLLTELSPAAIEASIIPSLSTLTKRHVVVIASALDPTIVRWSNQPVVDEEALFQKVAAVDSLATRFKLDSVLRARKVDVIDVDPSKLGPRIAQAYIQSKLTGRL